VPLSLSSIIKTNIMASIKHLFHINASKEKVFEALTTIDGLANWWTNKVSGDVNIGGIIEFRFGDYGGPDMKVKEIKLNESVTWKLEKMMDGWDMFLLSILIPAKIKPGFALNKPAGKKQVTFMLPAILVGEDIWKACGSFAKPERERRLEVRGTGNNFSKKASYFFCCSLLMYEHTKKF
jgi:uncharacterized protein YndB with AHSA1/START domain